MALYSYVKQITIPTKKKGKVVKTVSAVSFLGGFLLLVITAGPILFFEIFYSPNTSRVTPYVKAQEETHLESDKDYTKASVWFPKALTYKTQDDGNEYSLSISKFGIDHARVKVGSEDLANNLVQFTGPLPGKIGTPVIFGHSTLPVFYNPTDYKTIFTKLPSLVPGDLITVYSDFTTYTYQVQNLRIVSPDDLSVLAQDSEKATLRLITCVPPGTTFKRLAITAALVD